MRAVQNIIKIYEKFRNPVKSKWRCIIVDTREFKSELPGMLHRKELRIEPAMLDIGDYVLSPEICVERKSLLDLIGSITSGRLFTQLTQMTRHYTRPMLLIEFEEGKPFALRGIHVKTYQIKDLMEKLMLTILHFPKTRILWSPTPAFKTVSPKFPFFDQRISSTFSVLRPFSYLRPFLRKAFLYFSHRLYFGLFISTRTVLRPVLLDQ